MSGSICLKATETSRQNKKQKIERERERVGRDKKSPIVARSR